MVSPRRGITGRQDYIELEKASPSRALAFSQNATFGAEIGLLAQEGGYGAKPGTSTNAKCDVFRPEERLRYGQG